MQMRASFSNLLNALIISALLAMPALSEGHAFPDHSDPKVGSTVSAPQIVRIWFDGALEPAFSKIEVNDSGGKKVDSGNGRVNPSDAKLLEVSLPALAAGKYRVVWNIVSRDGHRTTGDFSFTVK